MARSTVIQIRASADEKQRVHKDAKLAGMKPTAWIRHKLGLPVAREPGRPPVDGAGGRKGPEAEPVANGSPPAGAVSGTPGDGNPPEEPDAGLGGVREAGPAPAGAGALERTVEPSVTQVDPHDLDLANPQVVEAIRRSAAELETQIAARTKELIDERRYPELIARRVAEKELG